MKTTTITIEVPDTVPVRTLLAAIKFMGLTPRWRGFSHLVGETPEQANKPAPKAEPKAIPHLRAVTGSSRIAAAALSLPVMNRDDMRRVPALPGSAEFDGPGAA